MNGLARLNALHEDEARAGFRRCCGSEQWVEAMLARRPFRDRASLLRLGAALWRALPPEEWKEAFAAHPRLGDLDALRKKFKTTRTWSASEQAGVQAADEETLQALARGNREYEDRFGYIFILCATGKSAGEMLEHLRTRLHNGPDRELVVAAGEQEKILRLRLEKWVQELDETR